MDDNLKVWDAIYGDCHGTKCYDLYVTDLKISKLNISWIINCYGVFHLNCKMNNLGKADFI